jgi:hypothetical protein
VVLAQIILILKMLKFSKKNTIHGECFVNKNEESFLKYIYIYIEMESSNKIIQQKCAEIAKLSQ